MFPRSIIQNLLLQHIYAFCAIDFYLLKGRRLNRNPKFYKLDLSMYETPKQEHIHGKTDNILGLCLNIWDYVPLNSRRSAFE